jgi:hypothetical protein
LSVRIRLIGEMNGVAQVPPTKKETWLPLSCGGGVLAVC